MISYKVFLTKSAKAAELIAKGFEKPDGWITTMYGAVTENLCPHIPSIYYSKQYFHVTVEVASDDDKYELVIC